MDVSVLANALSIQTAMGSLIEKTLGQANTVAQEQTNAAIKLNMDLKVEAQQKATIEGVGELFDITV